MTRIAHHYILTSRILRLRVSLLCLLLPCMALAADSVTQTVPLYTGLDLDTGQIEHDPTVLTLILSDTGDVEKIAAPPIDPLFQFSPDSDVSIGLSAQPDTPFAVAAYRLNGLTVLEDTPLSAIDPAQLPDMPLNPPAPSVTVDTNDLLVMQREDDRYALLGHVVQQPEIVNVRLTYWLEGRVTPTPPPMPTTTPEPPGAIPEPTTLGLLAVGILGLVGFMIRKQIRKTMNGGKAMNYGKILMLVLVFLSLLLETAVAAELKVIVVGSGDGDVEGSDISCPPSCEASYQEKTLIQLKAIPDDDSTFIGWMINGKPATGTLMIDQEDLLVAARFERRAPLDELILYWYNGNDKEYEQLALDEVAVFLKEVPERWYVLEGEFKTAMDEVVQLFHPEAQVESFSELVLTLKSPEPVPKETLSQILSNISKHPYIQQAAPVLYSRPGTPETQLIPTGEIFVDFPLRYTEAQITAIEQQYGLIRIETYPDKPNSFLYQAGTPLESIKIANRLYETGLVELSYPDWIRAEILLQSLEENSLTESESLPDHWHFLESEHNGADVIGAWNLNDKEGNPIRGSGVTITVVDDGSKLTTQI